VTILAVSDVVWQAVIAAVVTCVLAYMNQRTKSAVATTAKDAAAKVDEVKTTLETTTTNTDGKLNTIHTLVNGAMTDQMRLLAVALKRAADMSGDPEDIKAAELAEESYRRHRARQAAVPAPVDVRPHGNSF
jgi:hypothetical protein